MKKFILTNMVFLFVSGCNFPGLERSIFEFLNLFQFVNSNQTYTVSFEVSGLIGSGLVVSESDESLTIPSNGRYQFQRNFSLGSNYNVSITAQPTSPIQICEVSGGTGQILRENVTAIQVVCGEELVVVSGTVTGLSGTGLQLTNTVGSDVSTVSVGSTSFAFSPQPKNSTYDLAIATQPTSPWQTCSITNPSTLIGTIPDTGLSVEVNCVTDSQTLSIQVVGIGALGTLTPGNELVIQELNSAQVLNFTGDSTQNFATTILSGSAYNLQVNNPGGVITTGVCTIPTPTGTIQGPTNVVVVNCTADMLVQGTVTTPGGSASTVIGSGLELQIQYVAGPVFTNQSITLTPGQTTFSFPGVYPFGADFQVVILTQPTSPAQICNLTGTGTAGAANLGGNISDIVVNCNLPEPVLITTPGVFNNEVAVNFQAPVATGGEFRYTLGNGAHPDPNCTTTPDITTNSLNIIDNANNTIKIIQCRTGWNPSPVITTGAFVLQVADPTPDIATGTALNASDTVNFSTSTNPTTWTCQTSDVAVPPDPDCGATVNTCTIGSNIPFSMPAGSNTNVKARSCKVNFQDSNVVNLTYPIRTYQVGGTITGLTTPFGVGTFILQNNAGDNLDISANGSFTFATPVASGLNYTVTVFSQPTNPWQTCNTTGGTGTISNANITSIAINCTVNTYNLTGSLSGLQPGDTITVDPGSAVGTPFVLNDGDSINILAIASGTQLQFQITDAPANKSCVFLNPLQTNRPVGGANITNLDILCENGYLVGNQFQSVPAKKMGIHLQQGRVSDGPGGPIAGAADGGIGVSQFNNPRGVSFYKDRIYIVDSLNHAIRSIDTTTANTTTFVGGLGVAGDLDDVGTATRLDTPHGITTDGVYLYISEFGNHRIKKVRISSGLVGTIAGSGTSGFNDASGVTAEFNSPYGIAYHNQRLYIADSGNNRIRMLDLTTNQVTTFAGNGTTGNVDGIGTAASFNNPVDIVYLNGFLYVTNFNSHTIRRIEVSTQTVTTIVGQAGVAGSIDAVGNQALLNFPNGLMTDGYDLYFTEVQAAASRRIRRVDLNTNRVISIAGRDFASVTGSATGTYAQFDTPANLTTDGKQIYITDSHRGRALRNNELIAYYPLDGSTFSHSIDAVDLTENGTPGLTGTSRFSSTNSSYALNGSTDYFQASDTGFPNGANPKSICAWVRLASLPPDGDFEMIASYGTATADQGFGIGINTTSGFPRLLVSGFGSAGFVYSSVPFDISNRWTHICGLYDGTFAYIYMNGKFLNREIRSWNTSLSGGLHIGSEIGGTNLFHGSIADVRIYNRFLNEGEIQDLAKDANATEVGPSYSQLPDGLVLHYKLDDTPITAKYTDSGPNLYNLTTAVGTPEQSRGKEMRPADGFRAANGGFNATGLTNLYGLPHGNAPRTVCTWVKPERLPPLDGIQYPLFAYGVNAANQLFSLVLTRQAGFQAIGVDFNGSTLIRNVRLPLHLWNHVCASFNTSGELRFYLNGSQVDLPHTALTLQTTPTGDLRVAVGPSNFPGKIDDVRVYNNALTEAQIRFLATQIPEGLVAKYDFRGDVTDVSGNGMDLTPSNLTIRANRWGEPNSAYTFNGTNSVASRTSPVSEQVVGFGVTGWIRPTQYPSVGNQSFVFCNGEYPASGYGVALDDQGRLGYWNSGDSNFVWTNYQVPLYVWTHVGIRQQALDVEIFANGRSLGTFAVINVPLKPSTRFAMGDDGLGTGYFTGDITDIQFYSRLLTPLDMAVLAHYHPMQTSAWDPDVVGTSTMLAHYQAESLSYLASGNPIPEWRDNSGKNNHLEDSVSFPTFLPGAYGIQPGVRFQDTLSQYIERGSFALDTNNFSFFSVHTFQAVTPITDRFLLNYGNAPNPLQISSDFSTPNYRMLLCINGVSCGIPNAATKAFLPGTPFQASYQKNGINVIVHSNGDHDINTTLTGGPLPASSLLRIGARYDGSAFLNGNIGEILIFGSQLDSATTGYSAPAINGRQLIECYLSSKYGLEMDPMTPYNCP